MSTNTLDASEVISAANENSLVLLDESVLNEAVGQLSGAPLAISFLGQVISIAVTGQDFSLVGEGITFNRLTHPSSAKACIMQIHQEVSKAFRMADSKMNRIGLETQNVPQLIIDILDTIVDPDLSNSPGVKKQEIEIHLEDLKRISEKGHELSNAVIKELDETLETMNEMSRSLTSAKGTADKKLQEAEGDIKDQTERKEALQKNLSEAEKEYKAARAQRDKIEGMLTEHLKETNSLANLTKQALATGIDVVKDNATIVVSYGAKSVFAKNASDCESAINAAESISKHYINKMGPPGGLANSRQALLKNDGASSNERRLKRLGSDLNKSADAILMEYMQVEANGIAEKQNHKCNLNLEALESNPTSLEKIAKLVTATKTDVSNYDNPQVVVEQVLDLCKEWEKIDELLKHAAKTKDGKGCGQEIGEVRDRLLAAGKRLEELTSATEQDASVIQGQALHMEQQGAGVAANLQRQMLKALEVEHALLKMKEEQQERLQKRLDQDREDMRKCKNFLAQLEGQKLTQKNISEFVAKGLQCLVEMRHQWQDFQSFFDKINAWTESKMGPAITRFVSLSNLHDENVNFKRRAIETLYREAKQVVSTSKVTICLTDAYKTLSRGYFVPMINLVGRIASWSENDTIAQQKTLLEEKGNTNTGEKAVTEIPSVGLSDKSTLAHQKKLLEEKAEQAQNAVPEILQIARASFQKGCTEHAEKSKNALDNCDP